MHMDVGDVRRAKLLCLASRLPRLQPSGDVGDYAAVSSTATGNKATILAIAHAAANLHNMMERAARLRAERQQQQAGAGRTGAEVLKALARAGAWMRVAKRDHG